MLKTETLVQPKLTFWISIVIEFTMNQGMNLVPPGSGSDYLPPQPHSATHHSTSHYGSAPPDLSRVLVRGDLTQSSGEPPLTTTTPSSPPEYAQYQQSLQQQYHHQQQYSSLPLYGGPPPRIPPGPIQGGPNGLLVGGNSSPSTVPWTVGCTDGSFVTMALMQLQQQHHQELVVDDPTTCSENAKKNGAGGATIGDAGEANGRPTPFTDNSLAALATIQAGRSLYHDRLFHQSSSSVESILTSSCDVMGFDIAEMWLRTGPKTHQLTNSHLRATALEDSVRRDLVEVYYGEKSDERTHRLSPALCKRAKDANDVVWVTAHTQFGAEALRMSISNVRTAVAVPVCHESSNTNLTIIFFSIRR